MLNVIDYVPGTSPLHRMNPVTKLALAVLVIASSLLCDHLAALAVLIVLTLVMSASAGVMRQLLSFAKLLVPLSVIMLVMQTIFMRSGETLFLFVTDEGLMLGLSVCLRLLCMALPLIPVLVTTKLTDLANACVEKLHVPYKYAFTFTTALRFVPVFSQVEYDTKNPIKKLKLMLPLCIPLLISSVGKTDAAALAAEQRGFYLRGRDSSFKRYPLHGIDFVALAAGLAILAFGIIF